MAGQHTVHDLGEAFRKSQEMVWLLWKAVWQFLKTQDVYLPHDPAISPLSIPPATWKHVHKKPVKQCSWKLSWYELQAANNPDVHQLIRGQWLWHICAVEYYSAMKRSDLLKHAKLDGPQKHCGEQRKPGTISTSHLIPCRWNKILEQVKLTYDAETRPVVALPAGRINWEEERGTFLGCWKPPVSWYVIIDCYDWDLNVSLYINYVSI